MILSGTVILLGCLVDWSVLDAHLYALLLTVVGVSLPQPSTRPASPRRCQISSRMVEVVRYMHELELEVVGVGEEHRVVAWFVVVLRGRIQDLHAPLD